MVVDGRNILGSEEATRRRRVAGWAVGAFLLLLTGLSLLGDRGLIRIYQMSRTRAELTRDIARLREANEALAREARALREDRRRVEAIARRDLGLVRPGEMVYEFHGTPPFGEYPGAPPERGRGPKNP